MKFSTFIFRAAGVCLILAVLVYHFWQPSRSISVSTPAAPELPSPSETSTDSTTGSPSAAVSQPNRASSAPTAQVRVLPRSTQAAPVPGSHGGDHRTVEFRVIDGLAIAFGDIILGRPEAGSKVDHGVYEPSGPQLWDKPEIPYLINPDLPDPQRVEAAVAYFNQHTPVSFVLRTQQPDALVFEPGTEQCFSGLGKAGGLQPIHLARGCGTQEILHEMMHALGFVHEQSRTDRDQYVEVVWNNIEEQYKNQFEIVPDALMEAMRGTPFDYHSIMLYKPDTFAIAPGQPTLKAAHPPQQIEPTREGLSEGDIARLKRLFRL